ncbi:hypothetical protein PUN28_001293 [Cardiocondyla obscurior]|uniref:Ribosomal protein L33 n=1 Tax=Cardiocondyla obscurior TaxID=286306 RepID=A0AAW2H4D9_9HYME
MSQPRSCHVICTNCASLTSNRKLLYKFQV